MATQQKRPLSLSFSGLMFLLKKTSPEKRRELIDHLKAQAILYFGCTRDHIMKDGQESPEADDILALIRELVHTLEAEPGPTPGSYQRIAWRLKGQPTQDIYVLSELLLRNGHPPIGQPPLADAEASQVLPRHTIGKSWSEYAWKLICERRLDEEIELVVAEEAA